MKVSNSEIRHIKCQVNQALTRQMLSCISWGGSQNRT